MQRGLRGRRGTEYSIDMRVKTSRCCHILYAFLSPSAIQVRRLSFVEYPKVDFASGLFPPIGAALVAPPFGLQSKIHLDHFRAKPSEHTRQKASRHDSIHYGTNNVSATACHSFGRDVFIPDNVLAAARCDAKEPCWLRQHHFPDRAQAPQAWLPVQRHLCRYVDCKKRLGYCN